jgi:Uma2 family endonuclease
MTAIVKPYLSEEDYLTEERKASFKSEYYKGEVFAMSGATKEHNKIAGAIVGELYAHLKGKSCAVMPSDIRVYNPANTLYTYPDVVVSCEEEKYLDDEFDTLLNPTIIIEILSKSTQDYDRGTKFFLYRSIPSLQHYVLINSLEFGIEIFTRDGEQWILTSANFLEDELYLSAIDYRFKVKDMYAQVMNLLPKQDIIH